MSSLLVFGTHRFSLAMGKKDKKGKTEYDRVSRIRWDSAMPRHTSYAYDRDEEVKATPTKSAHELLAAAIEGSDEECEFHRGESRR